MIVSTVSASSLLRYDSVVRLTQYIPAAGVAASPEDFTSAWKEAFSASSLDGILYRELCRQVPEWSALAKREIDNPIKADFLEYTIVEPWLDLSALPALPASQQEAYSIIQDVHSVAFHFSASSAEVVGRFWFRESS
jgi:hypothetical protein